MQGRTKFVLTVAMLVVFAFGLIGCVTQQAGVKKPAYTGHTGFLSDYSKLKSEGDDSKIYIAKDVDFSKYDKILLDRITVWYKGDAKYKGIDPTKLKALTDYFHDAIVKALGDAYPVVDTPGPDVLRVRIALTDIVPTKPEITVAMAVIPYATAADVVMGGKSGHSPYLGETAMEGELLDSVTHKQLGAYVDRKLGKKYHYDLSKGTKGIEAGAEGYVDAYSTWGYAKAAFDAWAKGFRERLDAMRGVK